MATVRYTTLNGEVVAEKRSGVRRLYQPDPLGSTVGLVDSTQTQTDTFSYWPYGEERANTGTTPTPFRFGGAHGYYRDSTTRVYVRARTLDCGRARWATADPLGYMPWNSRWPGTLHAYGQNPTTEVDPSGLQISRGMWAVCIQCAGAIRSHWSIPHGEPTWFHACNHNFVHCMACCVLRRLAGKSCAEGMADIQDRLSHGHHAYPGGPGDSHKCRMEACQTGLDAPIDGHTTCLQHCVRQWPFNGGPTCSSKTGARIDCPKQKGYPGKPLTDLPWPDACVCGNPPLK